MKRSSRGSDGSPSAFLAKEAPLVQFDRQRSSRRKELPTDQVEPGGGGQFILAPGERVLEHYEVGPIIGAGAVGIVYKARHVDLGQLVALKVIRPDMAKSSSVWRRFSREARALSALHNQHVVRVHDAGTLPSGLRYLVMEFLTGCSLRTALRDEATTLQPRRAVDYAIQVCSALSDAHRANIIHRDVRPENIFLAKYKVSEPTIKLMDFGMALFLDDAAQLTATSRAATAPDYLSPEQLRDSRAVDPRSDLWAVGTLMYELITGRSPFRGQNVAQTCFQIATGSLAPIDTVCPNLPTGLAASIHHCLQVDPLKRPKNADELAALLEPYSSRHAIR